MSAVMQGVRVLEVAEHTFVPAASALLSDWGAEVIKIEHVERGDAMRGLASTGLAVVPNDVHVLLEHSNRGKKSLALDLTTEDGLAILHKLVATSDVFLTNKLPGVRRKLHIDVEEIRAHNPEIIYVRGTGQGERGPDADKGSYDSLAFWARSGVAAGARRPEYDLVPPPPAPGFGDSIGAMTIAGGIMGALFHRERTGEATTVDVSLFGVGLWAMGQALALSLALDKPWAPPPADAMGSNPLSRTYQTADDRTLWFTCLQAAKYWPLLCEAVGRPELAADPRFADHASLMANNRAASDELDKVFAGATLAEWRLRLADFAGQWAVMQDTLEATEDPQTVANGYVQDCETAGGTPFRLAAAPVQFDGVPAVPGRAPGLNEHGDAILEELGFDWDAIVDLKVRGVVA
jgi:crotonobetainyl-CoA:carnitine CoA-transferase CaiB-like acyl-CoA transferase